MFGSRSRHRVNGAADGRKAADEGREIGDDRSRVDVVRARRGSDRELIARHAGAAVPVENLIRRRERRAVGRIDDFSGRRRRRRSRRQIERPAGAARQIRQGSAKTHAPDWRDADERPQIVVGRLSAGPPVQNPVHQVHSRFRPVEAAERTLLALRARPDLADRAVERSEHRGIVRVGRADRDEISARLRFRVIRIAREQAEMEARDRVAVEEAAGEPLLIRAIDRVGEVGLFPQRNVLTAVRTLVDPLDLKRIGGRVLRFRVRVEPAEVVDDLLRQIRAQRRGLRIVGGRVGDVPERPSVAAHLVEFDDPLRAAQPVAGIGPHHGVVRPERHLLGIIAIPREQVRRVCDRRLVRVVREKRALSGTRDVRPVLANRERRSFDVVPVLTLGPLVEPEIRPLIDRHQTLGADAGVRRRLGLAHVNRP